VPTGDDALTIINEATCNATVRTGCGQTPAHGDRGQRQQPGRPGRQPGHRHHLRGEHRRRHHLGHRGATCNAAVTSGCRQTPAHVNVGRQNFGFAAADPATNLVYVTNYLDDTVSVINGATCNGTNTSGCGRTPPTIPAGANPSGLTASLPNHTIYAAYNAAAPDPPPPPPTPSGPKQRRRGRAGGPRHRAAGTDAQIRAYLRALQRQPPITRNRS
jgi:hypothetical protein